MINKPDVFIEQLLNELKTYCSSLPCKDKNFDIIEKIKEIKTTSKNKFIDYINNLPDKDLSVKLKSIAKEGNEENYNSTPPEKK